eukprot:3860412-Prymnesium_polylepis.1
MPCGAAPLRTRHRPRVLRDRPRPGATPCRGHTPDTNPPTAVKASLIDAPRNRGLARCDPRKLP